MSYTRRELLTLMVGNKAPTGDARKLGAPQKSATAPSPSAQDTGNHTWGMVIDLRKCIGCQACTVACAMENHTPDGVNRTVVSAYELTSESGPTRRAQLPRLCNHCADAPCLPVCPTQATFRNAEDVIVINQEHCIGCAYCVQACPYEARFVNEDTHTVDKCNFCIHRVEAGLLPACVETCVGGARVFGDMDDPTSQVSRLLGEYEVDVLKPEAGTVPRVYYINLNPYLDAKVEGKPVPHIAPPLKPEVAEND